MWCHLSLLLPLKQGTPQRSKVHVIPATLWENLVYEFFSNLKVISQVGVNYTGHFNAQGNTSLRRKLPSTPGIQLNGIKLIYHSYYGYYVFLRFSMLFCFAWVQREFFFQLCEVWYICNYIYKLHITALAVFPVRPRDRRNIEIDKSHLRAKEYGGAVRKCVLDFLPETSHLHQRTPLTQTKYLNR